MPTAASLEEYARGVRNTVGFDFPTTKALWFTDNGRDEMGDNTPSCELNIVLTRPALRLPVLPRRRGAGPTSPMAVAAKSSSRLSPNWGRTLHRWA
jgi:hypothetical protein